MGLKVDVSLCYDLMSLFHEEAICLRNRSANLIN